MKAKLNILLTQMPAHNVMKILIIRRDNIGDLILTTPLISALRAAKPDAKIDILVNSYCAPVLNDNPDLDDVFVYDKGHHRGEKSLAQAYWERVKLFLHLRKERYDSIIIAKPNVEKRPYRLAKIIGAKRIFGIVESGSSYENVISDPIYVSPEIQHVAEISYQIAKKFGAPNSCGKTKIFPAPNLLETANQKKLRRLGKCVKTIAIQISSRKIKQRWQIEKYAELIRRLHLREKCAFQVYWSPGNATNPMHPGDDEIAAHLETLLDKDLPVQFCRTQSLAELTASLATNDILITSDGGALHIGAALGLPIVCFFGNSDPARWHPWLVPHKLIQMDSADVGDISVDMAIEAYDELCAQLRLPAPHSQTIQIANITTTNDNLARASNKN